MSEAAAPVDAKKAKKAKKGDKDAKASDGPKMVDLAGHVRASAAIARLRSTAALGAFAFVGLLSHSARVPLDHCIMRGLVAGTIAYFVGWYVGVTVWRQLVRAELRVAYAERAAALEEPEA